MNIDPRPGSPDRSTDRLQRWSKIPGAPSGTQSPVGALDFLSRIVGEVPANLPNATLTIMPSQQRLPDNRYTLDFWVGKIEIPIHLPGKLLRRFDRTVLLHFLQEAPAVAIEGFERGQLDSGGQRVRHAKAPLGEDIPRGATAEHMTAQLVGQIEVELGPILLLNQPGMIPHPCHEIRPLRSIADAVKQLRLGPTKRYQLPKPHTHSQDLDSEDAAYVARRTRIPRPDRACPVPLWSSDTAGR